MPKARQIIVRVLAALGIAGVLVAGGLTLVPSESQCFKQQLETAFCACFVRA